MCLLQDYLHELHSLHENWLVNKGTSTTTTVPHTPVLVGRTSCEIKHFGVSQFCGNVKFEDLPTCLFELLIFGYNDKICRIKHVG